MDTWEDYKRSLTHENFLCWDYIILTASNEQQAKGFRAQLAEREKAGFLPKSTHFVVIPDPDGKRVGSGGATLSAIRYIAEAEGDDDFLGLRILVIHSGGDSKRVPQYSALGKLFSPVPRELPSGRVSTLFDELLIGMASVPSRIREGMLLLSGDVLLLFNPLQIDYSGIDAAAISFKEKVETGRNHGVFLRGDDGFVKKFLHKQSVETLIEQGAVNESGAVDIDTGAVIFSADILKVLFGLICENGTCRDESFERYVNEKVRLSLYGDFLFPLASDATLEDYYKEKPEGENCEELMVARAAVWNALRPFRMKVLRLAPAKFIHFGTTNEILSLMSGGINDYAALGWERQVGSSINNVDIAGYRSVLSDNANIGKGCYLEVSYVHSGASVGENTILSYMDIQDESVPSDVVMHGLKQKDGSFVVRIFGTGDNPKAEISNCSFLGTTLCDFMDKNGISADEIWETESQTLWTANLYPIGNTIREATLAALNVYELSQGRGNVAIWRNAKRVSLCSGFNAADQNALISWDKHMQELICMDKLVKCVRSEFPVSELKAVLQADRLTKVQSEWMKEYLQDADFSEKMRLYYYIGYLMGGIEGEKYIDKCFVTIRKAILENATECMQYNDKYRIVTDRHSVRLPLRVNWGGGWSDTPPYCNEHGGTVINAAILLGGEMPVEVTLERIETRKIVFESRDMDVHGEFDTIEQLQNIGDPYNPFALQKAALLACGVIPAHGGNLDEILTRLGGGFRMNSEVTKVPKGSGLGTSSILAGACAKALFEFFGINYTHADLYSHVLCMEQIMATGGGWQDQVGGLLKGIKYISSMPGKQQELRIENVQISRETRDELDERFVLIYTGQRRLARNLLRDVVGRYLGNDSDVIYALNEIQRVAALMRFELERGNVQDFAKLMNYHWELSKKIDAESSNTLIEQIFASIDDLIDGRMICGAGGGGFLQVILKNGVTKEDVHGRLKAVFQDSAVDVWDAQLYFE